jgi:hypothetical protein
MRLTIGFLDSLLRLDKQPPPIAVVKPVCGLHFLHLTILCSYGGSHYHLGADDYAMSDASGDGRPGEGELVDDMPREADLGDDIPGDPDLGNDTPGDDTLGDGTPKVAAGEAGPEDGMSSTALPVSTKQRGMGRSELEMPEYSDEISDPSP